jgi:twitching motility protein PilT
LPSPGNHLRRIQVVLIAVSPEARAGGRFDVSWFVDCKSGAAVSLKAWVQKGRELGASDVHLEAGAVPVARIRGELLAVGEALPAPYIEQVSQSLLGAEMWEGFAARGSADVSTAVGGVRCRINVYRTIRGIAIAVRLLTPSVSGLRAANLHPDLRRLVDATTGLVVISGPTGSGKSTTLAALIEEVNSSRSRNIITLESPLEYVFSNRRSFIRQREIPTHSPSFEQAIIDALRENPDVLVIGEMRTPEVIRLTLNAAETGHLVLATLHSATCAETLSRICMSFPAEIQSSIRAQLADCLVGVVCQRLEFIESHQLRVPRCEVLLANIAAKGTIRSGQLSQIANVIQAGGDDGMWTFDRYQRWIEQKKDWARAALSAPVGEEHEPVAPVQRASLPKIGAPRPTIRKPAAPKRPATPSPAAGSSGDGPIEISIEEDLDLAELAKQIERRST